MCLTGAWPRLNLSLGLGLKEKVKTNVENTYANHHEAQIKARFFPSQETIHSSAFKQQAQSRKKSQGGKKKKRRTFLRPKVNISCLDLVPLEV